MSNPDLTPATRAMADLVASLSAADLALPTPCPEYDVEGLLAHVHGLSLAFTAAADKELGPLTSEAPQPGKQQLPEDWRESTPAALDAMARAWLEPEAWTGMTAAGGLDLPGEVAGLVALDEIVLHGWDIAQAAGQPFDPGPEALDVVHGFLVESRKGPVAPGLFGPTVDVPESAALFDRALGLSGRDPAWSAYTVRQAGWSTTGWIAVIR